METVKLQTAGRFSLYRYPDPENGDYYVASDRTGLVIWEGFTEEAGAAILKDPEPLLDLPADYY